MAAPQHSSSELAKEEALTDEEMAQIGAMNQHDAGTRDFGDPQFVKYLIETYG